MVTSFRRAVRAFTLIELMAQWDWGRAGDNLNSISHEGNPDLVRVQKAVWGNDLGYQPN